MDRKLVSALRKAFASQYSVNVKRSDAKKGLSFLEIKKLGKTLGQIPIQDGYSAGSTTTRFR